GSRRHPGGQRRADRGRAEPGHRPSAGVSPVRAAGPCRHLGAPREPGAEGNALSALCAALAAGVTALGLRELLLGVPSTPSRPGKRGKAVAAPAAASEPWIGPGVLIATGLLLAFSRTPWAYATVTEVYALNTLLVA